MAEDLITLESVNESGLGGMEVVDPHRGVNENHRESVPLPRG